jgi:hypothetical protein
MEVCGTRQRFFGEQLASPSRRDENFTTVRWAFGFGTRRLTPEDKRVVQQRRLIEVGAASADIDHSEITG